MAASIQWRLIGPTGAELPVEDACVLGRELLGLQFDFVSRKQAVLTLDGGAIYLTAHGQNPTGLLLAGSTEWQWLRPQDGRVPITPGSTIALDKKRLETSQFTLRRETVSEPTPDWSCSQCTFINVDADAYCVMCEAPRAGVKRPRGGVNLRDRVGDDRRIRWDPRSISEPLDQWITATLPSRVSGDIAAWIQVENATVGSLGFVEQPYACTFDDAPYLTELAKVEAIIERSNRVPAEAKRACVQALLGLAQEQHYTTGKWMIFFPPAEADAGWETIARATAHGELGCSAKIAPTAGLAPEDSVVCCVYVHDFAERAEVRRVLHALRRMGMGVTSGFKPDVYTALNIMSGNQWRLEPTMYKVKEVLEWPADIARAVYK